MKLSKCELELNDAIKKEWVIANGLGGMCSSSVLGANTRKYHGLLVAPLSPPARRHVLISKLDENITIGENSYNLYTNICKDYISDGYKYLEEFNKKYLPEFKFKVEDVEITKKITMVYGRNTVVVVYKIKNTNKPSKLTLAPIVNFRDFHGMSTNHNFELSQVIDKSKVRVEVDGNAATPIYMYVAGANYIEHYNDIFRNMYYIKEEERGFYPEENLAVAGRFEIYIEPNEEKTITFVGSLEENIEPIDGEKVIENEEKRLQNIIENTKLLKNNSNLKKEELLKNEVIKDLIIATDSFIIYRPSFGTHSLLAGFPWFLDWGRDTLLAYEGIFLITKRYDLAKEILLTFTRDIKFGLVPNGYSGFDNRPLYNSVDASLLLFEQVNKYIKYTNDYEFIKENIFEHLTDIITNYSKGIDLSDNNIYVAEDNLLVSGTENTQNTWMDAKVGDFAVTPRNGKAVEINALWYNALKTLEDLAEHFGEKQIAESCSIAAKKHKTVFNKMFYNEKKKCLYDVLGDDKIRPNQLFALSLTYPVMTLSNEKARNVLFTCKEKLLTRYGLKTLSKESKEYIAIYEGDGFKRDMSYHQGITWVWLLGLYYDSLNNLIKSTKEVKIKAELQEECDKFKQNVYNTFKKELYKEDCIGSISELYNSKAPYKPGGTYSQAWSVSEVLRILLD